MANELTTLRNALEYLTVDCPLNLLSNYFIKIANVFSRHHDKVNALNCYIDGFLCRNIDRSADDDLVDFFRHQFAIYLLGKKNVTCSLCEGDMVCDLIKEEYENFREELAASPFAVQDENRHNLMVSYVIDFPWVLMDELGTFDTELCSYM